MNNMEILKAVKSLIGSNCIVSTPNAFFIGPKGYVSNNNLLQAITKHDQDISSINEQLDNKVDKDNLKTINGNSIIGTGNISITTQSGVVDLSPYLTIEDARDIYATKEDVISIEKEIFDLSTIIVKIIDNDGISNVNGALLEKKNLFINLDSYNALYTFISKNGSNSIIKDTDGLLYDVYSVDTSLASPQYYDNPITLLLHNYGKLFKFTIGGSTGIADAYPVGIKLNAYVENNSLIQAKNYTDSKLSKLADQHVIITDNYKEFSKESNVGRLLYITKETPIAYKFRTNTGYSIYTKVYVATEKDESIQNIIAYSDKFLTTEYQPSVNGFGDLYFTDYIPDYIVPIRDSNNPAPYVQTEVITEGLYYLPSVNNPVLLSSDQLVSKINDSISNNDAHYNLINKTLLSYNTGSIQLGNLQNDGIYEVQYNNTYQDIYYKNIAYLIKVGSQIFVWGKVRVDKYGVIYINPYSNISSWYQNVYSNIWEKLNGPEINSIKETVDSHIQSSNAQIEGIRTTMPRYYVVKTIDDWEELSVKIGDTIEMHPLSIPQHTYHVWKSSDGKMLYSNNFDLESTNDEGIIVYSDRNFNTVILENHYGVDEVGKHILNGTLQEDTKFYYVKTIDTSINQTLARKVNILTSLGYRKIAELF